MVQVYEFLKFILRNSKDWVDNGVDKDSGILLSISDISQVPQIEGI